jgi:hypothetical protein
MSPPIPYGVAKSIICSMADWEHRIIRPPYATTFYHAARAAGVAINLRRFTRRGEVLFAMRRLPKLHPLRTSLHRKEALAQFA